MRLLVTFLLSLSACGGKIVEDAPLAEPPPAEVTPATQKSLDACTLLCERDARCDTTIPALPTREGEAADCDGRCKKRLAGKCGIDDWLLCYAAHIAPDACVPLPDECRPSFCAWARCARQPVSDCE